MNHMTTLGQVAKQVETMSQNCFDEHVNVSDIEFDSLNTIKIAGKPFSTQPLVQRAICTRLGIPHNYLRKCPEDLQSRNLSHFVKQVKNEQLFARYQNDSLRALFSTRFVPVDNIEVMSQLDAVGFSPETEVQCHLDGEFMLLNIPDPDKDFTIKKRDAIRPGISIRNSEVGLSSLAVSAYCLRLLCTNGMISMTEVAKGSYRHVSAKVLDLFPVMLEEIKSQQNNQGDQFKLALKARVENPIETLSSLNRQFVLNEAERKSVVEWAWPQEMGDTMFHVVNAYTKAAQDIVLPAESSYRLQKVGGQILAMVN